MTSKQEVEELIRILYSDDLNHIERIDIDTTEQKVELNTKKPGPFIGRKGAIVNEARTKLAEKFGQDWKLIISDTKKKRSMSNTKKKRSMSNTKKKKRYMVSKPNLPLSVPFSSLNSEKDLTQVTEHIASEGPILVTLFRESVSKEIKKSIRHKPIIDNNNLYTLIMINI